MSALHGPINTLERDRLTAVADMLTPLPVRGAADLASHLACIAQTRNPNRGMVHEALELAQTVRTHLLLEASPDRWLDETGDLPEHLQTELVGSLIETRRVQAAEVAEATRALTRLAAAHPAHV